MKVTLLGTGCGPVPDIQADYVAGAARLIENCAGPKAAAAKAEDILRLLLASGAENCAVLYSGDTGFYSGARTLFPLLNGRGIEAEVLPGLSCVQVLAARLGRPWQDWGLYSAHGTDCDAVPAVCGGRPACFLTGGPSGPSDLCGRLAEATPRYPRRVPGIPDTEFLRREGVPMTKQEVRTAILAKLGAGPADTCWDVGAGTGSVSVELSLQCKAVWSVERKPDAMALARNPVFLVTGRVK